MAYTEPVSFDKFRENIELTGSHRETAKARKDDIVKSLKNEFEILDSFTSGSIPRYTAVKGLIYIASNPSMPGLLKIGLTNRNSSVRLKELADSTGVPTPFVLESEFSSDSPEADESKIHSNLLSYKKPKKEFFEVDRDLALKVCEEICGRPPRYIRYIEPKEEIFEDAIIRNSKMYCPECGSQVLRVSKKRGWGCKKCQIYFDDSGKQIPDPRK